MTEDVMNPITQVPTFVGLLGDLQEVVECTGTVAFAITGAVAAGRKKMDLVGVIALGCLVSVGGGTMRDLLLARPVFWVSNPTFVLVAAVTALAVVPLARTRALDVLDRYRVVQVVGAAGMALFAVIGTNIALADGSNRAAAVIVGVVSGVGGGVIRDIFADQIPEVLRNGQVYASAALVGATVYVVLLDLDVSVVPAFWIAFTVIFAARTLTLYSGLAVPTFQYERPGGDHRSDSRSGPGVSVTES
jgi:uncharacterized membrane protein YeiH